jgi:hypothetical protein
MRISPLIMLAILASACGVTTDVVVLNPAAPVYAPVSPDSVHIFADPGSVLVDYEPIATITAGSSATGTMAPDDADMLEALRETAGGLGADGLILGELLAQRPSGSDVDDDTLPARGEGTAIRFRDGSARELVLKAAARQVEAIRTIALAPLIHVNSLPMADTIRSFFEQNVRATLSAHGFNTVSGAVYDSVRMALILEVDGLFDPITGQRYEDRARIVEQRTREMLINDHGVDGFLIEEIWGVPALDSRKEPNWDGTRLTFTIRLENSVGASLHTGHGAVQPFAATERNREAVAFALAQLFQDGNW